MNKTYLVYAYINGMNQTFGVYKNRLDVNEIDSYIVTEGI